MPGTRRFHRGGSWDSDVTDARVSRGGTWRFDTAEACAAYPYPYPSSPGDRNSILGFRLVEEVVEEAGPLSGSNQRRGVGRGSIWYGAHGYARVAHSTDYALDFRNHDLGVRLVEETEEVEEVDPPSWPYRVNRGSAWFTTFARVVNRLLSSPRARYCDLSVRLVEET
jgi:hypothetical protein